MVYVLLLPSYQTLHYPPYLSTGQSIDSIDIKRSIDFICGLLANVWLFFQAEILNETSTASNQEKLGRVESIIVALLNTTGPTSNTRLFPQDLVTTTKLLNSIVDFYAVTLEEITNTGCIEARTPLAAEIIFL